MSSSTNANIEPTGKSGNIACLVYSTIIGLLFALLGILEFMFWLGSDLSLFADTESWIAWSENAVMALAFATIATVFLWGAIVLIREPGDRGKAYVLVGTALAIFLLAVFLCIVAADNLAVFVDTVDAEASLSEAEWTLSGYSPIYLGVLSLPGLLLFRDNSGS